MSLLVFVLVCAAGGLGAVLRFVVDGSTRARFPTTFPFGTALINVSGSFVLGLLTGLTLSAPLLPHDWEAILGTGLLGGYTTFSTASIETMRLVQRRQYASAVTNGLGVLILTVALGATGLWIGANVCR